MVRQMSLLLATLEKANTKVTGVCYKAGNAVSGRPFVRYLACTFVGDRPLRIGGMGTSWLLGLGWHGIRTSSGIRCKEYQKRQKRGVTGDVRFERPCCKHTLSARCQMCRLTSGMFSSLFPHTLSPRLVPVAFLLLVPVPVIGSEMCHVSPTA